MSLPYDMIETMVTREVRRLNKRVRDAVKEISEAHKNNLTELEVIRRRECIKFCEETIQTHRDNHPELFV